MKKKGSQEKMTASIPGLSAPYAAVVKCCYVSDESTGGETARQAQCESTA
ncbi:hypothetical protein [Citrobacter freundii]|uniref:Uncharacterized protein n=1 Tax=Citrobacter freundii TaxID=546 RepID=A0AAP5Y0Y6_CITFR|nr:hypothetical protein [Citrobacter freundii]ELW8194775.1 hypothetical protein [Yersinia enterocolitica]MDW2761422.1 hypothetical protein [Citrobacter freundii]HDL7989255.1 hypothetical protein [Yersinia enterocolitica]